MTEYTASNGMTVERDNNGDVLLERTTTPSLYMKDGTALALREFFQHERDEELGRWRWPENPDFVVYPDEDGDAVVLNERDGMSGIGQTRATVDRYPKSFGADAARAYFEAHPEKPWHEAIPDQAWVVDWQTEDEAFEKVLLVADFSVEGRVFADAEELVTLPITSAAITFARRIWPEDAS